MQFERKVFSVLNGVRIMLHLYILAQITREQYYIITSMEKETYKTIHLQKLDYKEVDPDENLKGEDLWNPYNQKKLLTYEQTCKPSKSCSNGIFGAFSYAYNNHGDVKLTPDDIWMTIMLYFSKYVNDNAQQLRQAFVSHQGKKKLVVRTQNELLETQWDEFFTLMIQEIKKNTTQGVTAKFQCNFSTTNRIEKILSTANIMNTFKKYFQYIRIIPLCGIQNVHFGGTLDDWKHIYEKTQHLVQYDVDGKLKNYVKKMKVILGKFIDTYQGKVDLDFWNKIMDSTSGSLGSGLTIQYSGWILDLFGLEDKVDEVQINTIDVDIVVVNEGTGVTKQVQLVGGFKAVSQEGKIFRPHLSMAIIDSSEDQTNSS